MKALRRLVDVRDKEAPDLIGSFIHFFFLLSSFYVMRPPRKEMGVAGGANPVRVRRRWLGSSKGISSTDSEAKEGERPW
jgi:hypothetical protein